MGISIISIVPWMIKYLGTKKNLYFSFFLAIPSIFWKVHSEQSKPLTLKMARESRLTKPRIYVLGIFLIVQRGKIDEVRGSIIGIGSFNLWHCPRLGTEEQVFPSTPVTFFNRSPSNEKNGSETRLHINLIPQQLLCFYYCICNSENDLDKLPYFSNQTKS